MRTHGDFDGQSVFIFLVFPVWTFLVGNAKCEPTQNVMEKPSSSILSFLVGHSKCAHTVVFDGKSVFIFLVSPGWTLSVHPRSTYWKIPVPLLRPSWLDILSVHPD